jgi:hypothetical protein
VICISGNSVQINLVNLGQHSDITFPDGRDYKNGMISLSFCSFHSNPLPIALLSHTSSNMTSFTTSSWQAFANGLLAATTVVASPAAIQRRGPKCTDFKIPVTTSAPTKIILNPPTEFTNPLVLVDFITSQVEAGVGAILGGAGSQITSGTYNMAMRYCEPENYVTSLANTAQYLQHAITNTKEYWNGLTYPTGYKGDMYSWIAYASKQGCPTLSVDNLGSCA